MKKYKYIQRVKRTITYPFRLVVLPIIFVFGACLTDWEDKWDRDYFWGTLKSLFKPW